MLLGKKIPSPQKETMLLLAVIFGSQRWNQLYDEANCVMVSKVEVERIKTS